MRGKLADRDMICFVFCWSFAVPSVLNQYQSVHRTPYTGPGTAGLGGRNRMSVTPEPTIGIGATETGHKDSRDNWVLLVEIG